MSSIFVRSCPIVLTALILSACSGSKSESTTNPKPSQVASHAEQTVKSQDKGMETNQENKGNMASIAVTEPQTERPKEPTHDSMKDKPFDNMAGKPLDNMADKPVDNMADKPVDNMADKPLDNMAGKPLDNVANKPIDNPIDKSKDSEANNYPKNLVENPTSQPIKPPVEQVKPLEPEKSTGKVDTEVTGFSWQYMLPRLREMPPYVDPLDAIFMGTEKTDNLYTLVVDGKKIAMLPDGEKIGGTIETLEKNEKGKINVTKTLHTDLQYAVTGLYTYPTNKPCAADDLSCEGYRDTLISVGYDPDLPKHIYFVQGFRTLDMPTSGYAEYKGQGNTFLVDFSENLVNGNLLGNQFTAKINGNEFATKHDPQLSSEDVFSVNGGFLGPSAAEIAGVYNDHEKHVGTFSAKKTQQ